MSLEQCSVAGCCSVGLQPRAAQRSCESRLPQPTLVRRQPSSRDEHAAERHMRLCRLVFPSQPVQLDYLQIQTFLISNRLDARPLCPIICKKKKKKKERSFSTHQSRGNIWRSRFSSFHRLGCPPPLVGSWFRCTKGKSDRFVTPPKEDVAASRLNKWSSM